MSEIHNYKTIFTSQVRDVDIEPLSLSLCQAQRRKVIKKEKKQTIQDFILTGADTLISHTRVCMYIYTHTQDTIMKRRKKKTKKISQTNECYD